MAKHDWQLIDKTVLPSACEQLGPGGRFELVNYDLDDYFRKTVVLTFKCSLTGDVKVLREHSA